MNFELKNLFTCLTQSPGLEKIDAIIKNEALNVLFSKIMDDTVGTKAKMLHHFWLLFQQYERTTLNNIYRQSVKWSNIVLHKLGMPYVLLANLSARTTKYK